MLELGFDLLPSMLSIIHLSELTIFIISNARFLQNVRMQQKVAEDFKFGNLPEDCV